MERDETTLTELEDQIDNEQAETSKADNDPKDVLDKDKQEDAEADDPSNRHVKRSANSVHQHLLPSWMTMPYLTKVLVKAHVSETLRCSPT